MRVSVTVTPESSNSSIGIDVVAVVAGTAAAVTTVGNGTTVEDEEEELPALLVSCKLDAVDDRDTPLSLDSTVEIDEDEVF